MDCFIDYIGLRNCSATEPDSGVYINDMAGMSIKRLDNISNEEKKTFLGVWNAIQKRCAFEMESRILTKFTNYYKIAKSLQSSIFGWFDYDSTFLSLESKYKGTMFTAYLPSYAKAQINTIELYSSQAYTGVKFYIYDLNSAIKQKEITVDLVEGYNKIDINYSALVKANFYFRLFLCYDASLYSLKQSKPNYQMNGHDEYMWAQDGDVSGSFNYANFIANTGSGISTNFSIECSLDAFICERKQLLKFAWSRLLMAEIFNETINSDRTNYFTTINIEVAQDGYNKAMSDFNQSIGDVLENMDIPYDEICFECNTQTKAVYGRP